MVQTKVLLRCRTMASASYYTAPSIGRLSSRLTWLLCLTRLFTLIFSQESDTSTTTTTTTTIAAYACVDPNNRQTTHQVRRGEITTVCLYVGPSGSWNSNIDYKRFSVNLIADEFSSYSIPGCKCVGDGGVQCLHLRRSSQCGWRGGFPQQLLLDLTCVYFLFIISNTIQLMFFKNFQAFATINENNLFNSDAVHIFAASQSS